MKNRCSYKRTSSEKKKSIERKENQNETEDTNLLETKLVHANTIHRELENSTEKSGDAYEALVNGTRDHQKPSKRKTSLNEYETSDGKNPKTAKKDATPVSLPPSKMLTLSTPSSQNSVCDSDDFSFLRRRQSETDSNEKKDHFSTLPDEVLLMMFKYFSKQTLIICACVCRKWKRIAYDNDLWPRIELSQRKLLPGSMAHVLMRGPQILRMSQTQVTSPIFKNMENQMQALESKLEYLDLSMAAISPEDLELLLRTCHSLQKLSLENCEVNENVCREISKNTKLSVLNMSQCRGLNENGLKSILVNCKKLVELNIAWTSLNAEAIKCVCQFVPKEIQRINLSGCLKEIIDAHVSALVIRCHKLKELDLSDATGLSESVIQTMYDNLTQLEVLSLNRCYNINPSSYSKLFIMSSVTHLNIFGLFQESQIESIRKGFSIKINTMRFSYIARPTVGIRRTSIWGLRVRDP